MATAMSPEEFAAMRDWAMALNGPAFVGWSIYILFYGVAVSMTFDYFYYTLNDPMWKKALVIWTMAVATAQLAIQMNTAWVKLVVHWGLPDQVFAFPVTAGLATLTTVLATSPIQAFFAHLAYKTLNRNRYFLAFIGVCVTFVFASGLALSIRLSFLGYDYSTDETLASVYLYGLTAVDIVTSGVLCWNFSQLMKNASDLTRGLLSKFILLSMRTAAFTTCLCLLERIFHAAGKGLYAQAPGVCVTGAFAICLLHTVNIRQEMQTRTRDPSNTSFTRKGGNTRQARFASIDQGILSKDYGLTSKTPGSEVLVSTVVLRAVDEDTSMSSDSGKEKAREVPETPILDLKARKEAYMV